MGRNRKGVSGADDIYRAHLVGTRFQNNPGNNRLAMLERMYIRVLTELAANRFKWEGFPPSIDVRAHELNLLNMGLSVVFFDKRIDKLLSLKGGARGLPNMYGNPMSFQVVGNGNYPSRELSAREAVPVWSNYNRVPDIDIVLIYATKLADIDRTIEINTRSARRGKVLVTPENTRLSVENINRQIDEGQATIRVATPLQDLEFIKAVDLGVQPESIVNLHILRTRLWNECMGLLGIENANQDKKERLVAAEVSANDDQTAMNRFVNLNSRQEGARAISKMFGLDIKVSYYTDEEREVSENEQLHPSPEEGV